MLKKHLKIMLVCAPLLLISHKVMSATIDFGDSIFPAGFSVDLFLVPWIEKGFTVYDLDSPAFTTAASISIDSVTGPRLKISPADITIRVEQLGPPLGSSASGPFDLLSLDVEAATFENGNFDVLTSKGGMQDIASIGIHSFTGTLFREITYFDIILTGVSGVGTDVASILLDNIVVDPFVESPPSPIPLPATIWLFSAALMGYVGLSSRKKVL